MVRQFDRTPSARIFRARFQMVVLVEALFEIRRRTAIKRTVGALENVGVKGH